MLREIGHTRQDGNRGLRRWFQDDYFDLYVWQDDDKAPVAMQLCYDRNHAEGSIVWSQAEGFSHASVESGSRPGSYSMTAILRASSELPYFRVYQRFLNASRDWDHDLRPFVIERLQAFRFHLFGRRRLVRRPHQTRQHR